MTGLILSAVATVESVVATASHHLAAAHEDAVDGEYQPDLYELAFIASEAAALRHLATGVPEEVALVAGSHLIRSIRSRIDGRSGRLGLEVDALDSAECRSLAAAAFDQHSQDAVLDMADELADFGLTDDLRLAAAELRRFGREVISPVAERIHRQDADIPDRVIDGLAALGVFGLSVPVEYGGAQDPTNPDHLAMVVATENLSRSSLAAGGSLITRPEILAQALLSGGTEGQRQRWLPDIASGRSLVAVAVTEPDAGSDVASVALQARRADDGWLLRGTKTWSTFAGRADLLMILARTDDGPSSGHRGLSLFVVEKPRFEGRSFGQTQPGGGSMQARAIPTIGYRGMHSFEVVFDDWLVSSNALIGEADGLGRGFQLQMGAFSAGRLQTAARAIGVMQAAFETARDYAADRKVFGRRLTAFPLTQARLAEMVARTTTLRAFAYSVAEFLLEPRGQIEAAMVKCLACRAAEEITRDAMQIHGGYGYAEEYAISRLFVDARVLSIFEGAEEVLALKVVGRRLLTEANRSKGEA